VSACFCRDGFDLWDSGNKQEAGKPLDAFITNLEISIKRQDSRIFTQNFLNAKYQELGDFFFEVGELSYLQRLMKLDEDHREYYEKILSDW